MYPLLAEIEPGDWEDPAAHGITRCHEEPYYTQTLARLAGLITAHSSTFTATPVVTPERCHTWAVVIRVASLFPQSCMRSVQLPHTARHARGCGDAKTQCGSRHYR